MISLRALAAGYLVAVTPFYLAFVTAYYPQYTTIPVAALFPQTAKTVPAKPPVVEPMVFQPLRSVTPQEEILSSNRKRRRRLFFNPGAFHKAQWQRRWKR